VWLYCPRHHKTEHHDRSRVVPLGPQAQAIVRRYCKADTALHLFSPREAAQQRRDARTAARVTPDGYGNAVGTHRVEQARRSPGPAYTTESYRKAIHSACDLAWPLPEELQASEDQVVEWRAGHPFPAELRGDLVAIRAWQQQNPPPAEILEAMAVVRAWREAHRWNPNQLRHSWATKVRKQFGLEEASVGLGHSSISTTLIYAERDLAKAIEVARSVG
jgi:integrase